MRPLVLLIMIFPLIGSGDLHAQDSLRISSASAFLSVETVTAGREPSAIADSASTYSLSSSSPGQKITAALDGPLPPGASLAVKLQPPAGATSLGMVTLTTTARDVVVNLPAGTSSELRITYQFTGSLAAGVIPIGSRSVTFTLKPGP